VTQALSGLAKWILLPHHSEYDGLGTRAQELAQSPRRHWRTRRLWRSTVGEVPQLLLVWHPIGLPRPSQP
jgi:hypothetical protein